jgi:NADH-quinone oxidoreductase subunit J
MTITLMDALLGAVGLVAVGAAIAVVSTQHLVRAGLWLVVTLGAIAVEFLLLRAEFVAWVQVLIYVGAVVVLLLFAVMLTRAPIGRSTDLDRPIGPAILVGAGAGLGLAALFIRAIGSQQVAAPPAGSAQRMGDAIFSDWVLPFEVLSVLLLAALVGAIVLSKKDKS